MNTETNIQEENLRYSNFSSKPICDFGCETEKVRYVVAKLDEKNDIWRLVSIEFSLEDAEKEMKRQIANSEMQGTSRKFTIFEKREVTTITPISAN